MKLFTKEKLNKNTIEQNIPNTYVLHYITYINLSKSFFFINL